MLIQNADMVNALAAMYVLITRFRLSRQSIIQDTGKARITGQPVIFCLYLRQSTESKEHVKVVTRQIWESYGVRTFYC